MFDKILMSASQDLTLWEKIAEWYQNSFLNELLTYLKDTYFTVNFRAYQNFTIDKSTADTIRLLIPALAVAIVIACLMTARVRVVQGRFVRRLLKNEALSASSAKTLAELELFRNAAIRRELARGSTLRMVVRCVHADGRDTGVGVYLDRSSQELSRLFDPKDEEDAAAEDTSDKTVCKDAVDGEVSAVTECAEEDALNNVDAQKQEVSDMEKDENPSENFSDMRKKQRGPLPKIDFTTAKFYIPEALKHRASVRFERRGSSWAPAIASIALVIFMTAVVCWLLPYVLTLADGIISLMSPQ